MIWTPSDEALTTLGEADRCRFGGLLEGPIVAYGEADRARVEPTASSRP